MGIIYLYTFPNSKQYIGQTKFTLAQRKASHIYEARHTPDRGCISLNRALIKYEFQFTSEIICEEDDCAQLNFLEKEFIETYKTLVPNGYNIKVGGNNEPHNPESVAKRAKSLRKNDEDKDLPYFTKRENKRGTLRWRINNHPLCSNKNFDTRIEMLDFLLKLENGEIEPIVARPRKQKTTPEYIYERKTGYIIEYKGKMLASFLNKNRPKLELLELAKNKVQEFITNGTIS